MVGGTKHRTRKETHHFCWMGVFTETMANQFAWTFCKIFWLPLFSVELYQIPFECFYFKRKLEQISMATGLVKLRDVLFRLWITSVFNSSSLTFCFFSHTSNLFFKTCFWFEKNSLANHVFQASDRYWYLELTESCKEINYYF